jgi:hypothetical protein
MFWEKLEKEKSKNMIEAIIVFIYIFIIY